MLSVVNMRPSNSKLTLSILTLACLCHKWVAKCQRTESTSIRNIWEHASPTRQFSPVPTSRPNDNSFMSETPTPSLGHQTRFSSTTSRTSDLSGIQFYSSTSAWNRNEWQHTRRPSEIDRILPPSVEITVCEDDDKVLTPKSKTKHSFVYEIRRRLKLEFRCNATFPIEWISPNFVGDKWEVQELRHFEKINRPTGWSTNRYSQQREPIRDASSYELKAIYTTMLTLKYKDFDNEFDSSGLVLLCLRTRATIDNNSAINSTLRATIIKDTDGTFNISTSVRNRLPENETKQYRELLGANIGCSVFLEWRQNQFQCSSTSNRGEEVDIIYDDDSEKCYDKSSCERSHSADKCTNTNNRATTRKYPQDVFEQGRYPAYGFVICRHKVPNGEKNDSTTAAKHFYHSLPVVCPSDDERNRNELYVSPSRDLDEKILEKDFMSFCLTQRQTEPVDVRYPDSVTSYVGENVTVSCVVSSYHFARGTRIGLVYNRFSTEYNPAIVYYNEEKVEKLKGLLNYTGTVTIRDAGVKGLLCESFIKQSKESVTKFLSVRAMIPQNISFVENGEIVDQLRTKTVIYTGKSDFHLKCEATGDPLPTIAWRKDGKTLSSSDEYDIVTNELENNRDQIRYSILKFIARGSEKSMTGSYTCQATNFLLDSLSRNFDVAGENDTIGFPPPASDTDSTVLVVSIVVPMLIVISVVIALLVWKIKAQTQQLQLLSKSEVDEFLFGKPEFLQHHTSTDEVNNYAAYLPYNRGYEISKEQLVIEENAVLGSGAYAIVLKGTVARKDGAKIPVAIKTARALDDVSLFKALLSELKIMGFIGTHPNIVNLVGAHTSNIQNREIFIAIEYCKNGSLLEYLRDHRNQIKNLVVQNPKGDYEILKGELATVSRESLLNPGAELNTVTLIKWAYEISNGMEFLSGKKVIHGDLAARNILLDGHLIAKIGDFGLSRQLFEYANYFKKQQSPLPWKWLAIESLQDMRFSVKSDVWAYGILLYELFSLGQVPYPGYSYNDEFLEALVAGRRPNRPSHADNNVYDFMKSCWRDRSDDRPNFTQVRTFFHALLYQLVPPSYIAMLKDFTTAVSALTCTGPEAVSEKDLKSSASCSRDVGGIGKDNQKKPSRFSFNTKTLSARFHR